jgi:cation:H+ antiporter
MIASFAYIALALVLLFVGAECLVKGSTSLALRAGLSSLMVGLTIVAFGTSSPELVVSIKAALTHQGDISVGNVVGSNSFNIGAILGLTALLCPIPVKLQIIRIDAPIALGVALLLPFFLYNHVLGRVEGVVLFAGIVAYTWMSAVLGKKKSTDKCDVPTPVVSRHWGIDVAFIAVGLGILILGSHLLVDHAVGVAKSLGVSEAVIGLTIVAAGTSMPELATSLVAALRKQPDLAIGNIVGSNIFNILAILGLASMVTPLHAPGISILDFVVMIAFSVLLIPLLYTGRLLHRIEGATLLALYGVYLFILWPK